MTTGSPYLDDVNVVDFRDENILGLHKDGQIQVAKKMLATRKEALRVLVHEFAHKISRETDGAKGHTEEVELLWADITEYLLTQQAN